ncbi:MAG: hypothetical protein AAGG51_10030 [Cyanobacteria bacterium P01_G01_bin.54]
MDIDIQLWPYLLIAAIPGFINLVAALQELDKRCRSLVFFQPSLSPGVAVWALLQISAPSILFWYTFKLGSQRPPIDATLVFEAFGLGVGFVALLNATTEVGTIPLKLKPIYSFFVEIAYDLIAKKQTRQTAFFWRSVIIKLDSCEDSDLEAGLAFAKEYFLRDISLTEDEQRAYQNRFNAIKQQGPLTETAQVESIVTLLGDVIRRDDLKLALQQFGFSPETVDELFKPQ